MCYSDVQLVALFTLDMISLLINIATNNIFVGFQLFLFVCPMLYKLMYVSACLSAAGGVSRMNLVQRQ